MADEAFARMQAQAEEESGGLFDRMPCLPITLKWGAAVGALGGAHRFISTRSAMPAADLAVKCLLIGSAISWGMCRYQEEAGKAQLRQAVERLRDEQEPAMRRVSSLDEADAASK
eukprot:PLAT3003.1.p1 GENE.PLAT3003.1~~PLAT3003.1.p1  ORF type:complete len:115 (-),score=37.86 PLAT3003.1:46-390(-)